MFPPAPVLLLQPELPRNPGSAEHEFAGDETARPWLSPAVVDNLARRGRAGRQGRFRGRLPPGRLPGSSAIMQVSHSSSVREVAGIAFGWIGTMTLAEGPPRAGVRTRLRHCRTGLCFPRLEVLRSRRLARQRMGPRAKFGFLVGLSSSSGSRPTAAVPLAASPRRASSRRRS